MRFMNEAIRLVIWDLDETFWRGTVTEGGIKEYIQANHDIIIELARRGIMSSICSKNDHAAIQSILEEKGLWDYFIFPSISWAAKGARIASLIEAVQLRPETVLFIDDNPNNLAETKAIVPGLQVAAEDIIPGILEHPLFRGKNDQELTRLAQYKLLEQKARDSVQHEGNNEDFLRSCGIRVQIDYDIENNIDRAVELINRTNQLNYTKQRLPEDLQEAREELRHQLKPFDRQAGLIRVYDKYGDYGYVGFFMTLMSRRTLIKGDGNRQLFHFCFSCRTLGMYVEQWVYEFLERPELKIVGEVLTDLSVPRPMDWISLADPSRPDEEATPSFDSKLIVYGGCEAHIVSVYLKRHFSAMTVYGNFAANGLFLRINTAEVLLDMCDRDPAAYAPEAAALGLPMHLTCDDIFGPAHGEQPIYMLNLSLDAHLNERMRHGQTGWGLTAEPRFQPGLNFIRVGEQGLLQHIEAESKHYDADKRAHLLAAAKHVREHYTVVPAASLDEVMSYTRELIERVPLGGRIVFAVNHHVGMELDRTSWVDNRIIAYREALENLVAEYSYAGIASVSEVLRGEHEQTNADHYVREVYLRFADLVVERTQSLLPRPAVGTFREVALEPS